MLPELNSGLTLSTYFYAKNPVRNFLLKKYGQRVSDLMVDILSGNRPFPTNVKEKLKQKIKETIF